MYKELKGTKQRIVDMSQGNDFSWGLSNKRWRGERVLVSTLDALAIGSRMNLSSHHLTPAGEKGNN